LGYRPFVYHRSTRLVTLTLLAVLLPVVEIFPAGREKVETWLEVRSPHFIVASNAGGKDARRVADRFERIRAVFQGAFPRMRVDPAAPIIVLAVKDEKSFRTLEPESWRQKGQLRRSGLFLRGPEKNYVILRLDSGDEQPYHLLIHEYTHLLIHQNLQTLPLWLDEGLAEFYGNSDIHEKEVWLGEPSASHVALLRESKLLPLETLFRVDYSSPYYNEQNKGTMFYAESWALVHYLMIKGSQGGKRPLTNYLAAVAQEADPTVAASHAFGDLPALEKELQAYVRQSTFPYVRMKGSTEIDDEAFAAREVAPAEAAAWRGDFLAHDQSYPQARVFLEEALREDPSQTLACEGMGFLEFRQGNQDEARKWFARAVKLNSQSYLADYYYGVMTMQQQAKASGQPPADVESSLRSAIKINPNFAPAYDALSAYYVIRGENLDQAHLLSLQALTLDPGNIRYFLNGANVLLRMRRADDAVRVGERALTMAKSPEERAIVETFLASARQFQQYLNARTQAAAETTQLAQQSQPQRLESRQAETHDLTRRQASIPASPEPAGSNAPLQDTVEGKIVEISCKPPVLKLTLQRPSYKLELHARDYHQVDFRSASSAPAGSIGACSSLKNRRARIVYRLGNENAGEIVSVQLLE
jgi:tetratricopeptide (TPR) repeat protein